MDMRPKAQQNVTPAFNGHEYIRSLRQAVDPGLLHQKNTLAGWISLIADDRGLGPKEVAGVTGIDRELAAAILGGTVMAVPLSVLDGALRKLENRAR
ncbi:MAG TPA: hypothetical protein VD978_15760 [Azospirillum sp.]|nr:hypothetical protein [Azospirillum sp.]